MALVEVMPQTGPTVVDACANARPRPSVHTVLLAAGLGELLSQALGWRAQMESNLL